MMGSLPGKTSGYGLKNHDDGEKNWWIGVTDWVGGMVIELNMSDVNGEAAMKKIVLSLVHA